MADEKKKPDLKARLNRTAVGNPPGAGAAPDFGGAGAGTPSAGLDPVGEPVIASSGSDIAVPEFIKQQMAEKAAAEARAAEEARQAAERSSRAAADRAAQERARAMAADPFSSSSVAEAPLSDAGCIPTVTDGGTTPVTPIVKPFQYSFVKLVQVTDENVPWNWSTPWGSPVPLS